MSDQCRYCNSTELTWAEFPELGWRLLNPNGTIHRCAEYSERYAKTHPAPPRKKKSKHGAFLRVYGPKGARTHAVLVQTREPAPDTPEAMAAELDNEPREPMFSHRAK